MTRSLGYESLITNVEHEVFRNIVYTLTMPRRSPSYAMQALPQSRLILELALFSCLTRSTGHGTFEYWHGGEHCEYRIHN